MASIITPRPLESALFGETIASCTLDQAADAAEAVEEARSSGCTLLIARVSTATTSTVQAIERLGGVMCDILLTSIRSVGVTRGSTSLPSGFAIRTATQNDAEEVGILAGRAFAGFGGHWHADPRLAADRSTELYARWAKDLVRGMGSSIELFVVTNRDQRICAFVAIRDRQDATAEVALTAVDPDSRGHGLLALMLDHIDSRLGELKIERLAYETQVVNTAALRTVSRAGFLPSTSRLTFHLWLD